MFKFGPKGYKFNGKTYDRAVDVLRLILTILGRFWGLIWIKKGIEGLLVMILSWPQTRSPLTRFELWGREWWCIRH